jgi:hypothetical protein
MEQVCREAWQSMFSLYRVIPESLWIRFRADSSSSRDSAPALDFVALQAIPSSRSRKRNAIGRRYRAALFPAQMHRDMPVAIDAVCVLRLSNPPMPSVGEA